MPWGRLLSGVLYNPLKYQYLLQSTLMWTPCRKKRGVPLGKGGQMYKLQERALRVRFWSPLARGYASNLVAVSKDRYYPVPWGRLLSLGVCITGGTVVPNYLLQSTRVEVTLNAAKRSTPIKSAYRKIDNFPRYLRTKLCRSLLVWRPSLDRSAPLVT